jgi:hypothetical protein
MANTGLHLSSVSLVTMVASGYPLPDHHGGMICVGRLQPDLVLVSHSLWKIVIIELPIDCSSEQLAAAHKKKMRTYAPILEALQAYRDDSAKGGK